MSPIAICYLFVDGDDHNKCLLFADRLIIIKDGREHLYSLNDGFDFRFTHKKWMLPFVGGWILLCISLLFIFRNQFNPWVSLFILMSSVFAIYIGWEGSEMFQVNNGSVTHSFPVKRATNNLKLFGAFLKNYLKAMKDNNQSLLFYHIAVNDSWLSQQSFEHYTHSSLIKEKFIHCSTFNQIRDIFEKYFDGSEDYVLITIDPLRLTCELKMEYSLDRKDLFPHIYGPINKDAIVSNDKFSTIEQLSALIVK